MTALMMGQIEHVYVTPLMANVFVLKVSVVPGVHSVKDSVISSLIMVHVQVGHHCVCVCVCDYYITITVISL